MVPPAGFEGCSFVDLLIEENDRDLAVHAAAAEHLGNIRAFVRGQAEAAGVQDPEIFARQWHILMKGSLVSAGEGDVDAARGARLVGELLLRKELAAAQPVGRGWPPAAPYPGQHHLPGDQRAR